MSEITQSSTNNGHEIKHPVDKLTAAEYRGMLAGEFGIDGGTPAERVQQVKELSQEGIAIMLEKVNALAQGSTESLMDHESMIRIGGKSTIAPEHRYEVFTHLVEGIKAAPKDMNPARVGDTLAMGVVLLHPFHDGNGRTARLVGMIFHDEFDSPDYDDNFRQLVESRDDVRKRGGYMLYGYTPDFPENFDQSNPASVSGYLSGLLDGESARYKGPFGEAPLYDSSSSVGLESDNGDIEDEIIENYESFREQIATLHESSDNAELIGAGTHSEIFKISKDGKEYAVRVVGQKKERVEILHSHIAAGARTKGMEGLEQIAAASYEEGMIVSEFVAGRHLQELTTEQLSSIPDAHIDALLSARIAAMKEGVVFDNHPPNILYDQEEGFTDIDYHLAKNPSKEVDRVEAMKTIAGSFDLTEQHLYESDSLKKEVYGDRKMALRERVNRYMMEHFSAEEYKKVRAALVFSIAWRQAGAPVEK